jgi:hypothetical protein
LNESINHSTLLNIGKASLLTGFAGTAILLQERESLLLDAAARLQQKNLFFREVKRGIILKFEDK